MKRCIYHHPAPILDSFNVGSKLRPNRMLNALKSIGYEVDEVTGYSEERKKKIEKIKKNISNGIVYDFVYAENSNDPIALADADHIPRHPFMDISFFGYCRKNGIPVGVFYRDIYWKFPDIFRAATSLWKRILLIPLLKSDLKGYGRNADVLFLPTLLMKKYIDVKCRCCPLPPGGNLFEESLKTKKSHVPLKNGTLHLLYVGGTGGLYDNRQLFQAVMETDGVVLKYITRKNQWEAVRAEYEPFLCDRIEILHKSADEIKVYYESSDISVCCLSKDPYLDIAMPIKVFESVSYGTPLLISDMDAVAEVIGEQGIGWIVADSVDAIKEQLENLKLNPDEIGDKTRNTIDAAYKNTWEVRARQVVEELIAEKDKGDESI